MYLAGLSYGLMLYFALQKTNGKKICWKWKNCVNFAQNILGASCLQL